MKAHGSATTFHVSNLDSAMRFYTGILGFRERFRFGDYGGVEFQEVQIHLSGPASTNKRTIGQGSIYVFCTGVDGYFDEVTSRGAMAQAPPKNYPYGMRDFVVEDPDGNLVAFGEEVKP